MLEKHSTTQAHFFMIGLLVALTPPFNLFFLHAPFFWYLPVDFYIFPFKGFLPH
jgi:hypothetical protein